MSVVVWLGVATLVALGWVDERRREDDEAYSAPRPTVRERADAARAGSPAAAYEVAPTIPPPAPPTVVSEPAPAPAENPLAEPPAEPTGVVHQSPPDAPGFWHVPAPHNGEGSSPV